MFTPKSSAHFRLKSQDAKIFLGHLLAHVIAVKLMMWLKPSYLHVIEQSHVGLTLSSAILTMNADVISGRQRLDTIALVDSMSLVASIGWCWSPHYTVFAANCVLDSHKPLTCVLVFTLHAHCLDTYRQIREPTVNQGLLATVYTEFPSTLASFFIILRSSAC